VVEYLANCYISSTGVLGKLKLKIPWKNIKTQPAIVQVENVFLVLSPQYTYAEVRKIPNLQKKFTFLNTVQCRRRPQKQN
jgi:hypothetical protein